MNKEKLKEEIRIEIENIERLNKEMKDLLTKIEEEPSFVEIRAAASILHDFYSSVERIFKNIALLIDKNLPSGENWHIELLSQMAKPFANVRGPVISEELFDNLKEYLKFRHLFRHIYGFELKWERFKELCTKLEDILREIKVEIEKLLKENND
jgi:hypothetical protein